ncbi:hypothetical protein ACQ4M3_12870 [Leptolyngbya sp. AN03gr2]|uniref:hypothetical protein n=1 Tax=unclassified Leptolyngbya TaxID=2650499 RepID=UPI003D31745A
MNSLNIAPIVTYPKTAKLGLSYIVEIDIAPFNPKDWTYEEEEYPIYCLMDSDLFDCKPVSEPTIVLHRFGGTYGAIKFHCKVMEIGDADLKITLINRYGVPFHQVKLNCSIADVDSIGVQGNSL